MKKQGGEKSHVAGAGEHKEFRQKHQIGGDICWSLLRFGVCPCSGLVCWGQSHLMEFSGSWGEWQEAVWGMGLNFVFGTCSSLSGSEEHALSLLVLSLGTEFACS